ncbi:hypothetical protein I5P86_08275 [Pseudomonas glycinae]|uniref:hypothetical protein n=1 Tax=Pseudomonas TaxID=286 RepID=UPI0018D9EBAC|nr:MULTISPECIES: hypothetical protein [Pseudomonas]MBH3405043.1 hypothetical protein [Pseudomonas glycinae]MDI3397141.1 hypothetical protein [Pseudomonas sp. V88_4]
MENKSVSFVAVPFVADVEKIMESTIKITIVDLGQEYSQSFLCERIAEKYGVTVVGLQYVANGVSAIVSVVVSQTNRKLIGVSLLPAQVSYKSLMEQ